MRGRGGRAASARAPDPGRASRRPGSGGRPCARRSSSSGSANSAGRMAPPAARTITDAWAMPLAFRGNGTREVGLLPHDGGRPGRQESHRASRSGGARARYGERIRPAAPGSRLRHRRRQARGGSGRDRRRSRRRTSRSRAPQPSGTIHGRAANATEWPAATEARASGTSGSRCPRPPANVKSRRNGDTMPERLLTAEFREDSPSVGTSLGARRATGFPEAC